jgi:hypothetical protein
MRSAVATLFFLALMLSAPAAIAAPTCQDQDGGTIKCGIPGAMPVGWSPSPEHLLEVSRSQPPGTDLANGLEAFYLIALILALIALLPEFDGTHAADWGHQEGDTDE